MSALGQKQTSHVAVQESALPPKADIGAAMQYVRFVPIADIELGPKILGRVIFRTTVCTGSRSVNFSEGI